MAAPRLTSVTRQRKSLLESTLAPANFERFSTLRDPFRASGKVGGGLISEQIRRATTPRIDSVLEQTKPIVDPRGSSGQFSVIESLDWSALYGQPISLEALQVAPPAGLVTEALADRAKFGPIRLADPIKTLTTSSLIASAIFDTSSLDAINASLRPQISASDLINRTRFEPGNHPSIGKSDSLSLGRSATSAILDSAKIDWNADLSTLGIGDLVAPVRTEDEVVPVAFPPDLIEPDPLSTEFEIDAIVAESQIGAQVFLELRSPKAAARMAAAREHLREDSAEDLAFCLTACRRALHALADSVYEPRSVKVKDRRGKLRRVDAEAFKNRLLMFLSEAISSDTQLALALQLLDSASGRLDALLSQLNKGVHADVLRDEAIDAYVETWAFIARVVRATAN